MLARLLTAPPRPEQVTGDLTFSWKAMTLSGGLGKHWYSSVTVWWGLSVFLMFAFIYVFGVML
jgi:hypothetical protein